MHGLNQFPLANMGGVRYLLGLFTVTVNRSSVLSVQLGKGTLPLQQAFFNWLRKIKYALGKGVRMCLNVHLCGTSDLRPVQLINCKIYKVFEVDSGIRLKAAV